VVHALPGVEKLTLFLVTRSVSTIQQFGVLEQVLNSASRAAGRAFATVKNVRNDADYF
jgi:hypothetical protein